MRVMILGADGYLGWPTAMYFSARGHEVFCIDNYVKSKIESECGVKPLILTPGVMSKTIEWKRLTDKSVGFAYLDIVTNELPKLIDAWEPDTIIHYAEQPSAPYSMMGPSQAMFTQTNNIIGTLNLAWACKGKGIHIIKLGTMGEYGTPNIDIEEGWLNIHHKGRQDRLPYPKLPGSLYHASKVADSVNLEFLCRAWELKVTDLNQGVVYGVSTAESTLDKSLATTFHYDAIFGTVLNRFVTQAVCDRPLTVYGLGNQTRGYLNIGDTMRCVELAALNPAKESEFRVFNQFTEQFSVNQLADKVAKLTGARIEHIDNPRTEKEEHYYHAAHTELQSLGLEPTLLTDEVLQQMLAYVEAYADNIDIKAFQPEVNWR